MVAVGMLLTWFGYSVSSWGWCLLQGYDITFGTWVSPLSPYNGLWPPPAIPPGQVFPSGADQPDTSGVGTPPGKIPGTGTGGGGGKK